MNMVLVYERSKKEASFELASFFGVMLVRT